jgi:hypothetical protein
MIFPTKGVIAMRKLLLAVLAIAVSPPLFAQNSGNITSNQSVCIGVSAEHSTVGVQVTGTWTGTLQPQVAIQGQALTSAQVVPSNSTSAVSTITANGVYYANVGAASQFCILGNTVASGTAVIFLNVSKGVNASTLGGSGGGGVGSVNFAGSCNAAMPTATTVSGTDDTAAFNTQLTSVMASNSTTHTIVFPAGKMCLFNSAAITLPNNGDSFADGAGTISSQNPLRLTCSSAGGHAQLQSSAATINQLQNGCVLLMTFNAGSGNKKLISLGMGQLEIDHLSFISNNPSDLSDFFLATNTSVNIHDNMFIGAIKAVNGTPSVNDAIALGGNATATPGMTVTSPFQGYPATVERNWFNQVRRAFFCGTFCNGVHFNNNTIWSEGGNASATSGAVEINCGANCNPPPQGTSFFGNILEIVHYNNGYFFSNGVTQVTVASGGCFDGSEFSSNCIATGSTANTVVVNNIYSSNHNLGAANVTTSGFTADTDWARANMEVLRTDDFLLLSKSGHYKTSATGADTTTDTSPSCTQVAGTCTFTFNQSWASAPRCVGTWNGTGTLTGLLKVIPTTTNVACTSTVGTDTAVCSMVCVGAPR